MARVRLALTPDEWPRPGREAWQAALVTGDLLDPGGLAAGWAPTTRNGVSRSYGQCLAWLATRGPLDPEQPATVGMTREIIAGYVTYLRARYASSSVEYFLTFLLMAVRVIAPDEDWSWLRSIVAKAKRLSRPARDKRPRLQATDDLLDFGMELMAAAEGSMATLNWRQATDYRDGLMIALLALRPLRRGNFCSIEIDRHLIERNGRYMLLFERDETKPDRLLEQIFPAELTRSLERYLAHYRPWLCRRTVGRDPRYPFQPSGRHLWVSRTGSADSAQAFYMGLRKRTAARFGRSLHPHLFRDCAATSIATDDPDHVRITMDVLGHAAMATSERHYNHAQGVEATRRVQDHILALRRGAETGRRGRGRRPGAQED